MEGKMSVKISYLGHACFEIEGGGSKIIIDPFLTGNPQASKSADDVECESHQLLSSTPRSSARCAARDLKNSSTASTPMKLISA